MRKIKKITAILLITLCLAMSLTACGKAEETIILNLVEGNISEIYLGEFDDTYLKIVDATEAEAQQAYLENMQFQAEAFAMYWGIVEVDYGESFDDLDTALQAEIIELMKEIYGKSKFEVQSVAKQDDTAYSVKVVIEPVDIMEKAYDVYTSETYEPLNDFWNKYAETDFSVMSDEEYSAYMNEYCEIVLQIVKDLLPDMGYCESKTQSVLVESVNDLWQINEYDWSLLDSYLVTYP